MNQSSLIRIIFIAIIFFTNAVSYAQLSNHHATKQTRNLYRNLQKLDDTHIIFGQQDALAYGVGWKNIPGQSDIKLVVNDQPGIYGWDIAHIELDSSNNIDGVPFKNMLQYIQEGYERGAVITISWHARNPLSGGSAWDTTKATVKSILPGGNKHFLFRQWLNKVANFLKHCKDKSGRPIPILFRPFHELTGNWFWWGKNFCTPDEFKQLWSFTHRYLIKSKKLQHLIFVYNSSTFNTKEEYLERYPGDDKVDVLSLDAYQYVNSIAHRNSFIDSVRKQLLSLHELAKAKNKIAAFAETGLEAVPDATWWTNTLWPAIKGTGISYVLVWRNHGFMPSQNKMHYYGPYPGQISANNFQLFYNNPGILFEKALSKKNIYN